MTHSELIFRLETVYIFTDGYFQNVKLCKKTLEDYISMAMALGTPNAEVVDLITKNSKIKRDEAQNAVNKFESERLTRGRAVIVKGGRFNSIKEAAERLAISRRSIERMLEQGTARYV